MGLVIDSSNSIIYVGDRHLISRVDINWNQYVNESYPVVEVVGRKAYGFVNGNGSVAMFYEPRFVIIDSSDRYLYVSDVLNYAIRRVDLNSAVYDTTTYAVFSGQETNGIALSSDNSVIYAVATSLNGLWKIPVLSTGVSSTSFTFLTNPSKAKGQLVDGPLESSLWYRPGALTIDRADNLYVVDNWDLFTRVTSSTSNMYFNYAIRRVSTSSGFVTTMAGKYCSTLKASNRLANPSAV